MLHQFHIGRVIEPHTPTKPGTLHLHEGAVVRIESELPHEPGWVQCRDLSGAVGRVPKNFLAGQCDTAIVRHDYIENQLSIRRGKVIIIGEESGWLWCVDQHKNYGWLPKKKVKLLE